MFNLKRAGAAILVAASLGVVGAAPANAYTTNGCYWRVSQVMPFRTLHEEVCYINFSGWEEELFPGFVDGPKVMTKYYQFAPTKGNPVQYGYQDTWWPDESHNA